MKKLLIKIIKIYQKTPLRTHLNCKYIPSCSEYGIIAIERYGALKGSLFTIKRILKCNPFSKGGIDLALNQSKVHN